MQLSRFQRIIAWGLFTLTLMLLSGWLLADRFTPRAVGAHGVTLPLSDTQTALDRDIVPRVVAHGGKTGAILIADGVDAFAARALSAREAGRSLDLQYYIWHNDLTGRLLAREAYLAAERGVHVRMILDDLNDEGSDASLLALDAHPNIEIRLYNPFRNRLGVMRVVELAQRVYSVNHRMHNKQWIADGRVAILGGRNIGEEYFDASEDSNFRDLDVLLFGPKVAQASAVFDQYWNSDAVVPISSLTGYPASTLSGIIERVHDESSSAPAQRYLQRMQASAQVHRFALKALKPIWTDDIEIVSDPPLKWKHDDDRRGWLVTRLAKVINATKHKALLISPYFVPGEFTDMLVSLAHERGAQVGVVTNSLAANDVPAVHSGYAKYRPTLLSAGVHLYEIRANAAALPAEDSDDNADDDATAGSGEQQDSAGLFGSSSASLHTKAFVADDRYGFIGSFNLDPRSAYLNTEMGVLFDDPTLAAALRREYLKLTAAPMSYWVTTDPDGDLRWLDRTARPSALLDHEPDSSLWRRGVAQVLRWLPIESQL